MPPPLQQTLPRQCKQRRSLGSGVNASFYVQQNDEDLTDKASIIYLDYINSLSRNLPSVFREFSKWTRQHVCVGLLYSAQNSHGKENHRFEQDSLGKVLICSRWNMLSHVKSTPICFMLSPLLAFVYKLKEKLGCFGLQWHILLGVFRHFSVFLYK